MNRQNASYGSRLISCFFHLPNITAILPFVKRQAEVLKLPPKRVSNKQSDHKSFHYNVDRQCAPLQKHAQADRAVRIAQAGRLWYGRRPDLWVV